MSSFEDFDVNFVNGGSAAFSEGRCVFKVNSDMHFEALNVNNACCTFFKTDENKFNSRDYRIDELIHPEDKSRVFRAIGSAMATGKPIDLVMRVISGKDFFTRCVFKAKINRYDETSCPVFYATFRKAASFTGE